MYLVTLSLRAINFINDFTDVNKSNPSGLKYTV